MIELRILVLNYMPMAKPKRIPAQTEGVKLAKGKEMGKVGSQLRVRDRLAVDNSPACL